VIQRHESELFETVPTVAIAVDRSSSASSAAWPRVLSRVRGKASKAPFSKDFEDAVGLACESASVRQVARQFGLVASCRAFPRV
jgi:hypothetical protein